MRTRHRALPLALMIVMLALLTGFIAVGGGRGCGSLPAGGGGQGPGAQRPPQVVPPARQSAQNILTATDLFTVYEAVLTGYVDRVDHTLLIDGALRGMHETAVEDGFLLLDSAILDTMPVPATGDPERDWARFAARYEGFLGKLAARVGVGGIGQAAARGMLASLQDPHTRYLDRRAVEAEGSPSYAGVGIAPTVLGQRGPPMVREVFPGSPAEGAGVRVGDTIVAVDGRSSVSMTLSEAVQEIRGLEGTQVTLKVRSAGESEERDLTITRAAVRLNLVMAATIDGATYVRIRSFQEGVAEAVARALQQGEGQGATGWIIDLRGNGGGSFAEVVTLANLFLGDQLIGIQVGRSGRPEGIRGREGRIEPLLPTVVLVDGDTASGAEVLAAALQEHRAARLVGVRTAGRVGIATTLGLRDGSGAQITSQRILSPSGARLDGTGVEPDDIVRSDVDDWIYGRDPQLAAALQSLRQTSR